MLIDGLNLAEGSSAQNFTISSGSSFPLSPLEGEAFYRNDGANEGLYLYDGAQWVQAGAGFDPSAAQTITGLYSFTQPISGVSPIAPSDLSTKQYVDNLATGLDVKLSVKAATTANITLTGTQTIDGIALVSGDRVLVKDQTAGAQNGIYVVGAGAWARSTDADNSPVGEVTSGMFTLVTSGTANANKGFVLTSADPITLDSTALVFTQFSGGASAPTLTATQIGFGSGTNVLSGSTKFTWVDASNTITIGANGVSTTETTITTALGTTPLPNSPNLTISTGASGSGQYAGALTLKGGVGTGGGGAGGHVIISGGSGGWSSGNVTISTGGGATGTQGYLNFMTSVSGAVVERLRILANGAWSVGSTGTAYGTSGQVLTSNGNAAPTWSAAPTAATLSNTTIIGTTTAAQNLSAIANSSNAFTISGSTHSSAAGGNIIVKAGAGPGTGASASLIGATSISASYQGGNAIVIAGDGLSNTNGGTASITGGLAPGGGYGGQVNVYAGASTTGVGGIVNVTGGSGGTGTGGNVQISAGSGNVAGGALVVSTGAVTTERLRILANGAWSVGTGGTAYGAAGQVLTSNGNGAPTWSTALVSSVAGRTGAVTLTVADIPDAQPKTLSLVSQSIDYTCVLADSGKVILHPAADTTARTFTIPANASVPYPVGTVITFINQNAGGVISIAITTDVMRLAGPGTVGTRSLAANGLATATKITSAEWIISGVGLT